MKVIAFIVKWTGFLVGLGAMFFVAMALAGPLGWPFELFTSWPYLVAAIGLSGAIVTGLSGWPKLGTTIVAGSLVVVALAMASPGDLSRAKAPPLNPENNQLIWGNVLGYQANATELMHRAHALDQAVLATGEVPRLWKWEAISERRNLNQVQTGAIAVEGCANTHVAFRNQGNYGGEIRARTFAIKVSCPDYTLFAVHLTNPLWERGLRLARRGQEMEELARAVKAENGPVVVIGDFNIPPNTVAFSRFIKQAGVAHTSCAGRWRPTWRPYGWRGKFNDANPLTGIPIDHLFTRDVQVVSCTVGKDFGSDHLPLLVELKKPSPLSTQTAP
jgi:endonuclease/exonuclease/phosphatase (EEP) superfamily protein YafD